MLVIQTALCGSALSSVHILFPVHDLFKLFWINQQQHQIFEPDEQKSIKVVTKAIALPKSAIQTSACGESSTFTSCAS